jgi:thioredoxin reductase
VEDKSIIIIGAGIAGLSAGSYGQMNGYHTRIFEMSNTPGGGLPPAAYSGRNLIQILCKGDRRKFITTVPKAV